MWQISRPACEWSESGELMSQKNIFFAQSDLKKKFRPNPMAGCWDNWGFIGHRVTESQSDRVTELQTLKGTQYSGGWNFFMPDFNELPYSLRSQGDKKITIQIPTVHLSLSFTHTHSFWLPFGSCLDRSFYFERDTPSFWSVLSVSFSIMTIKVFT